MTRFQIGDKIFGTTIGLETGCHAEFLCIKESAPITKMPDNISFEEAASIPFGAHTSLDFLKKAKIC